MYYFKTNFAQFWPIQFRLSTKDGNKSGYDKFNLIHWDPYNEQSNLKKNQVMLWGLVDI